MPSFRVCLIRALYTGLIHSPRAHVGASEGGVPRGLCVYIPRLGVDASIVCQPGVVDATLSLARKCRDGISVRQPALPTHQIEAISRAQGEVGQVGIIG